MNTFTRFSCVLLVLLCAFACFGQTLAETPIPNTYGSIGATGNLGSPVQPAFDIGYGFLANSATSAAPTYAGFRCEIYRDTSGKLADGCLATAKVIPWRNNRFFLFGDPGFGGMASLTSVSTAVQLGIGAGVILGKAATAPNQTPHWAIEVESRAQRIPALTSGIHGAFLVTVSYSFNRPQ